MSSATIETLSEDPVLVRAAEWFERFQHSDLTVEDVAQWQRWMSESAAHREAFEEVQATWQLLDNVPAQKKPADRELNADRYEGRQSVAAWRARSARPHLSYAMAAAILVIVGATAVWKITESLHSTGTLVFETQAGEHREIRLPDGSDLALGGRSLVWIDFSSQQRQVVLDRGEAFFTVAKEVGRPFQVRAGDSTITALGTAFNVRRSGERIVVAVADGAVKVGEKEQARREVRLAAGEQVVVESSAGAPRVSRSDPAAVTAWRKGRMQYLGEPLKYVVADVNRYSTRQISVGDQTIGDLLVSGTVFENDVEGWLRSLEEILPVDVERRADGRVVLTSRDARN